MIKSYPLQLKVVNHFVVITQIYTLKTLLLYQKLFALITIIIIREYAHNANSYLALYYNNKISLIQIRF